MKPSTREELILLQTDQIGLTQDGVKAMADKYKQLSGEEEIDLMKLVGFCFVQGFKAGVQMSIQVIDKTEGFKG